MKYSYSTKKSKSILSYYLMPYTVVVDSSFVGSCLTLFDDELETYEYAVSGGYLFKIWSTGNDTEVRIFTASDEPEYLSIHLVEGRLINRSFFDGVLYYFNEDKQLCSLDNDGIKILNETEFDDYTFEKVLGDTLVVSQLSHGHRQYKFLEYESGDYKSTLSSETNNYLDFIKIDSEMYSLSTFPCKIGADAWGNNAIEEIQMCSLRGTKFGLNSWNFRAEIELDDLVYKISGCFGEYPCYVIFTEENRVLLYNTDTRLNSLQKRKVNKFDFRLFFEVEATLVAVVNEKIYLQVTNEDDTSKLVVHKMPTRIKSGRPFC